MEIGQDHVIRLQLYLEPLTKGGEGHGEGKVLRLDGLVDRSGARSVGRLGRGIPSSG